MKRIINNPMALLAVMAAFLFVVLAVASAFRRDGGASLLLFCFSYIMYNLARGFASEKEG